jgi:hypothetical protein
MRKFPWIVAALTSACCVLLLAGALFPIASDLLAGLRDASISPASAKVIRIENGDRGNNLESSGLPGPPPTVALDSQNVRGVLGSAVRSATDEDMGRVVDVIVDRSGDPRAAVIDFGGFLGVGSRKIAIDWSAMRFSGLDQVTLDLTRDQVKAAPAYEPGKKTIIVLGASPEFARSRVTARTSEP